MMNQQKKIEYQPKVRSSRRALKLNDGLTYRDPHQTTLIQLETVHLESFLGTFKHGIRYYQ
jgi:hypothetical protein